MTSAASITERFERRKSPRQHRSRATVESIQQAALQLAADSGFAALGTGVIAERAGVSIGSLYQYFPNCEAILLSLYDETSSKVADAMRGLMIEILDQPLETGVPRVINRLLDFNRRHRLVLMQLVADMPELRLSQHPVSFENLIRGSMRIYLQRHCPQLKKDDIERKVFFLEQIINGCVRNYLKHPPQRLSTAAFVRDLSRIAITYIVTRG